MLVSALLGGAGVKAVELLVAWRKESSAATVAEEASHRARVKEYADLEASLRKELRGENETLRDRVKLLESGADSTSKTKALTADTTNKTEAVSEEEDLKKQNDELRRTNAALAESQSLMAQTILTLRADLEAARKPKR